MIWWTNEFVESGSLTILLLDPVFFLHHTQIDRLWWNWQHQKASRIREYAGFNGESEGQEVSLQDVLPMAGMEKDVIVEDILSTDTALLCYKY